MIAENTGNKIHPILLVAGSIVAAVGGAALLLVSLGGYILVVVVLAPLMFFAAAGWLFASASGFVARLIGGAAKARSSRSLATVGGTAVQLPHDVDIFRGLSSAQMSQVAALGSILSAPAGEVLGKAGERGTGIFILLSGRAELSARSGMGEMTVRIAEEGETLPLAALLGDGALITSITAMTDVEVLAIPRDNLLALFRKQPDIGSRLYANVAEILAGRYRAALFHFTSGTQRASAPADLWANV
ncbi:MAG: cyclic nucleotide-binding domain-containing protein [Chloroflexi bacterium]|nr:cyclic nucleotide-binding domain-containing protein [Chloroflexota bacterium]